MRPKESHQLLGEVFLDTTLVEGGLLHEGSRLIIGGEAGTGKSYLALQLAAESSVGKAWLGLWALRRPLKTLVVQVEVSEPIYQSRLRRLREGFVLPRDSLYLLTTRNYSIRQEAEDTKEWCDHHSVDLAIFDPLYQMHEGDENAVHTVKPSMRAFDLVGEGRAVVLVHHMRKPQTGMSIGIHSLRGSSAWVGWADTVMFLAGKPGGRYIWLHIVKARNRNEGLPKALKLEWQPRGEFFAVVQAEADSDLADVQEIVEGGSRERAEIVKGLVAKGYSRTAAYRAIKLAEDGGLLADLTTEEGGGIVESRKEAE